MGRWRGRLIWLHQALLSLAPLTPAPCDGDILCGQEGEVDKARNAGAIENPMR